MPSFNWVIENQAMQWCGVYLHSKVAGNNLVADNIDNRYIHLYYRSVVSIVCVNFMALIKNNHG